MQNRKQITSCSDHKLTLKQLSVKKYNHNPVRNHVIHCFNVVGSDKLPKIEMCIVNKYSFKLEQVKCS